MRLGRWTTALAFVGLCSLTIAQDMGRMGGRSLATAIAGAPHNVRMPVKEAGMPRAASEHALFRSSYVGNREQVIATTRYGSVTAEDIYLWILLRSEDNPPYLLDLYQKATDPLERERLSAALEDEIDSYVFTNLVIPTIVPATPCDPPSNLKAQLYALPAYQLAYLMHVVKPRVCIQEADRVKYLKDNRAQIVPSERWRVRYILIKAGSEEPTERQSAAEDQLMGIREQILAGKISFADAARKYSQASSAPNGGEIPPFSRGEVFFGMEDAAAGLVPGGLSKVFPGPGGFYLAQLIEVLKAEEPSLTDAQQAQKVEDGLFRKVLAAQFQFELRDLKHDHQVILRAVPWDERADCDVVGEVCDFAITKRVFQDMFPQIEAENLKRRDNMIQTYLRNFLEQEAMAQEVRSRRFDNDPVLVRAREIATNMARRDSYIESLYGGLKVNEKIVREFWQDHPELFTPLPLKRVIKLTLNPVSIAPTPEQTAAELTRILNEMSQGNPPSPAPIVGTETTMTAQVSASETTAPVVETIQPEGGKGMTVASETTVPATSDVLSMSDKSPGATASAEVQACEPPRCGPGPAHAGFEKLRPRPWFAMRKPADCLIEDNRAPHIPPLPLTAFPRRAPSVMKSLVPQYRSADWVLAYEDLGYMYLQDRPTIPPTVEEVPVGAASSPLLENGTAVSYFIEDARGQTRPSFHDVEARAYVAYRQTRVAEKIKEKFQSSLEQANVETKF